MTKSQITQEILITKFRNSDLSEVFELDTKSNQILWTLRKIKKDFKIEEFIPVSVLTSVLVDALGISVTSKIITNALNPIKNKIHSKIIEGEMSYKIMHDGISYIEKLLQQKMPIKKISIDKQIQKTRDENMRQVISQVRQMGIKKDLQPGLYYVVLIDLVGSTVASSELSPEENTTRIKQFIKMTRDALTKQTRNYATFVKDIGDASLFLFSNFQDILDWADKTDELCNEYNKKCIKEKKREIYQMYSKKCVHLGEVHFDDHSDPIALAVNQISKIEKEFKKDQLGITDAVKQVILPRIKSGELKATMITKIILQGENEMRPLWNVAY